MRHDFFHEHGCRLADHGLAHVPYAECTESQAEVLFAKVMSGHKLDAKEADMYKTALLIELMRMNAERGWAQQFHFGRSAM